MKGHTFNIKVPSRKDSQSADPVRVGQYTYHPHDSIGLGFSSNVYLGYHVTSKQQVAIKVADISERDPLRLQFLESQISILEKIRLYSCKYLLKLVHHERDADKIYIITQFCEGKDLSKLLRSKKQFNEEQAQTIMKQVLMCYKELYGLGLVHRDIKLSNFMLQEGKLKLGDFGFATTILDCLQEFAYNAGSPFYMPPESLKRNRFSFESDVWALGVMAYELVFGQLPYRQKVDSILYDTIMASNIEQKLQQMPSLSPQYKKFITRCLQKDMRRRMSPEEVINYQWPQATQFIKSSVSTAESLTPKRRKTPEPLTPNYYPSHTQNTFGNTHSSTTLRAADRRVSVQFTIPTRVQTPRKKVFAPVTFNHSMRLQQIQRHTYNSDQNYVPYRNSGKSFTESINFRHISSPNIGHEPYHFHTRTAVGNMTTRHINYA